MAPKQPYVIVTDSTADLPAEMVERYGIYVIPQNIIWGGQTYRDRVDMSVADFYQRLRTDREFPKTSQPSAGAFQEAWQAAVGGPETAVLSIHISSGLSGTLATAETARGLLPGYTIELVDSRMASLALGYQVLAAARAREAGATLAEAAAAARALVPNSNLFFVLDTLEYLHRGGRIGGAARLVGTMLNLKPVLQVLEGRVEPLERVRTRGKAIERMLAEAHLRVKDQPVRLGLLQVGAEEEMARLAETIPGTFNCLELITAAATPTIGAHVGPGTIGLACVVEP